MGQMLIIVGAILIALSVWSLIKFGMDMFVDRMQYWGMKK